MKTYGLRLVVEKIDLENPKKIISRDELSTIPIKKAKNIPVCRHFLIYLLGHPSPQKDKKLAASMPSAARIRPCRLPSRAKAHSDSLSIDFTPGRNALDFVFDKTSGRSGYAGVVAHPELLLGK